MANRPTYCSLEDMRIDGNRWQDLQDDEATRATNVAAQASRLVDRLTGTWFYDRHLRIKTQAPNDMVQQLFMPAPVISLSSVTENTVAMDLTDVLTYPSWLEKDNGQIVLVDPFDFGSKKFWSRLQQGIVIEGHFGLVTADLPQEITKLTAHIASTLMGWATRTYTTGDGVEKQVYNTDTLPDWAKAIISDRKWVDWHGQVSMLTDL